jgi:hypothetical protein
VVFPKIFAMPIHSSLAKVDVAPSFNRLAISSTEYANCHIRLLKYFKWSKACWIINPVSDFIDILDGFETFGKKNGITVPNTLRMIDTLADDNDPAAYGPPAQNIYETDARPMFSMLLRTMSTINVLCYLYDKGLREGDIIPILGGGLDNYNALKKNDPYKWNKILHFIPGAILFT